MSETENRKSLDTMKIYINLEGQVGEDVIFLKDAVEKAGVNYIDIEQKRWLAKKFRSSHPEYDEYRMFHAEVPTSWQSMICYTVFTKVKIYDPQYMLAEAMENTTAGEKVRCLRRQEGMSLKDLSKKTGLSYRTLQNIETGVRNINVTSVQTAKKIAEVLGVSIEEITD